MRQTFLIFLFIVSLIAFLYAISTPKSLFFPWEDRLSEEIILEKVNQRRGVTDIDPLSLDSNLSNLAKIKMEEMFEKQYFDYFSPSGKGIMDLLKEKEYDFDIVEMSIIKGYFEDEESVVDVWIESQEYQDNIYNPIFSKTGIASGYGIYEDTEIFMAVQVFGVPASDCIAPDEDLYSRINYKSKRIEVLEKRIGEENISGASHPIIMEHHSLKEQVNLLTNQYNREALNYQRCLQGIE